MRRFLTARQLSRGLATLVLLTSLTASAVGHAQETPTGEMRRVTVAIDREFNPYEFSIGDSLALGFTPEIMNLIAEENHWEVRYLAMDWPDAINALNLGRVDLVSMIRTPAREKLYHFSATIATIDQTLFVRSTDAGRIKLKSLSGKLIAIQKGDMAAEALQGRTDFNRRWVDSKEEGFLALQKGAVDGFFCANKPGEVFLEKFHMHAIVRSESNLFPQRYAFAGDPKNRQLIATIDRTLAKLKDSGAFAALEQHWLAEGLGTASWWQRHLIEVITLFSVMLLGLAVFSVWTFVLQRKHRQKSLLVEQALDITTELIEDLREQKRQADLYLEISETMIIGLDTAGKITLANQRAAEILGQPVPELLGLDWFDHFIPAPQRLNLRSLYRGILNCDEGLAPRNDGEVLSRNGDIHVIQWHNRLNRNHSKEVIGSISSGIDISPRIKAQRELIDGREKYKQLSDQFESLLNGVTDPLLVIDRELKILWANEAARSCWCFPNAAPHSEICHQGPLCKESCIDRCIVRKCFESGEEYNDSIYDPELGRTMKVRIFPALGHSDSPSSVIILAQDITEVLRTRAEMARASQLASVGELAANVAHEINNPLHGVINYAEILRNRLGDDAFLVDLTTRIINEGERIRLIVKNLLSYTRRKEEKFGPVSLNDVIRSADMLIGIKLKMSGIQTRIEFPDDLPLVRASGNQLQQVLINLLSNAHDALSHKRFEVEDKPLVVLSAEVQDGLVTVRVEDNGAGIPEHLRKRIMEAFFTTKPEGQGTGLGLSICKSIIEDHQGTMEIDSCEGEWTRISFTLPIFTRQDLA